MIRHSWHSCQPGDLHALARRWFLHAKRIEMTRLARELGISRATAYRWAGSQEQLLGEVLASLVDETFERILGRTSGQGIERVLEVLERGMRAVHEFAPLRAFLVGNPQLGLRIVASKHGPVQARTIDNIRQLLEEEIEHGNISLMVEPGVMAYALTRIIESFLYADLITGAKPDFVNASRILRLMLRQDA